jgi:hypothetical protein
MAFPVDQRRNRAAVVFCWNTYLHYLSGFSFELCCKRITEDIDISFLSNATIIRTFCVDVALVA